MTALYPERLLAALAQAHGVTVAQERARWTPVWSPNGRDVVSGYVSPPRAMNGAHTGSNDA